MTDTTKMPLYNISSWTNAPMLTDTKMQTILEDYGECSNAEIATQLHLSSKGEGTDNETKLPTQNETLPVENEEHLLALGEIFEVIGKNSSALIANRKFCVLIHDFVDLMTEK